MATATEAPETALQAPQRGGELLAAGEAEERAREAVAPGLKRPSRYRPERLSARLVAGEIPRAGEWKITEGRLFVECRKGAAIFCRKRSPSERESIAAEAYLRIVERYGGELPPRGALLDGPTISPAGIKLIRRAVDSAVKAPRTWRETDEHESDLVPLDVAAEGRSLTEADESESGYLPGPPSAVAEDMRGALMLEGLTRKEATAVIVRAAEMSNPEAAEAFNVGAGSVSAIVSQGVAALRERFPDGADLVALLQGARARLAEEAEREARDAISWVAYCARNPEAAEEDNPGRVRPQADYRHAITAARRYVGHVLEERGGFLPRGATEAARAVEIRQGKAPARLTRTESIALYRARTGRRTGAPLMRARLPRGRFGLELAPKSTSAHYSFRRLSEQRRRALADLVALQADGADARPAPVAGRLPAPRRPLPTAPRARVWTAPTEAPESRYLSSWGAPWGNGAPAPVKVEWGAQGARRKRRPVARKRRLMSVRRLVALISETEARAAEHVARAAVAERERRAAKGRRLKLLAAARRKHAPGAEAARLARLLRESEELTPEERTALGVAATWEAEESTAA